jgi:hypothetical protein
MSFFDFSTTIPYFPGKRIPVYVSIFVAPGVEITTIGCSITSSPLL